MNPLISIIIPTYKRDASMIQRAIDSVLNQSYDNWELIIVDDNGLESDFCTKTQEFMKKYISNKKIFYFKHDVNKGANAARNTGIRSANGELIAFLDSDDEWIENKLEITVDSYEKCSDNNGVIFSSYYFIEQSGRFLDTQNKSSGKIFYKEIFADNVSPTSAVVVKKQCFDKAGYFDEDLPARQDYDMWLRISRYYEFYFIDKPLVYIYRDGHEAISSNYKKHIEGTERVLKKIYTYLTSDELNKYKLLIDSQQYNYISLVCIRHEDYKLSKKYSLKAFEAKKNIKSLILIIFSY
ncbi:glycosyltransferase family 2 protein, partial [Clostridium beijerinckii]|uniref:glycosyltransferase family 2 protein n=1 Tax=Clostridium beijerinckii TaxID=1520 RepID=UPI0022DF01D3